MIVFILIEKHLSKYKNIARFGKVDSLFHIYVTDIFVNIGEDYFY